MNRGKFSVNQIQFLASFRTSPWDVNENLPLDYARIFKFKRWSHAKIRAKKWKPEIAETIAAGQKITIGKSLHFNGSSYTSSRVGGRGRLIKLDFSIENV